MKKLVAVLVIALAFVVGCSTGDTPAPAPTVTVTEDTSAQDEAVDSLFQMVWNKLSWTEQHETCTAWTLAPDLFWSEFQRSLDPEFVGLVTQEQFNTFFEYKCR